MRELLAPLARHRARLLPLGVVLLVSYAYFVPASAWNQNSRLALTRALVERQESTLGEAHITTGDKSYRDGAFYSDKAPGVSWLSIPPYAALHLAWRVLGQEGPRAVIVPLDPEDAKSGKVIEPDQKKPGDKLNYNGAHLLALWLCTLFAVAIPTVAGTAALWLLARAASGSERTAVWVALTYGLATPVFAYATSLYGHALCGSLLLVAAALLWLPADPKTRRPFAWVGACLGAAVVTEYTAAPVAVFFLAWALWSEGRSAALRVIAGALPFAAALGLYHWAAFGHPLSTGYDYVYREEFASGMAVRYGLGLPDPSVAVQLLLGSYRGLFYLSPVLLLGAWGLTVGLRPEPRSGLGRPVWIAAGLVFAYFWLLSAGYYMWDGGAAAGPRHMVPAIGFLALGLALAWKKAPLVCAVLAVVSAAQMLIVTAASPELSQFGNPLWEHALQEASAKTSRLSAEGTNLGALLGLGGLASLMPLLALWLWAWPRESSGSSADVD